MGMLGMVGPGYRESIKAAATLDDVRAAAHRFDAEDLAQSHPIGPSYAVSKAALIRCAGWAFESEQAHTVGRHLHVAAMLAAASHGSDTTHATWRA
jgi:hypothetical protein